MPSSSVSFRNLTKLEAAGCKELMHLVQLVAVHVYRCRAMIEVVISDKDGVEKEDIVFSKLKRLELLDLDRPQDFALPITRLNSHACKIYLWLVVPNWRFSLQENQARLVWYGKTSNQRRWANNDLNTTIQQLHPEKVRIYMLLYLPWKNFTKFAFFKIKYR